MKKLSKDEVNSNAVDRTTYKQIAAHVPHWPLHPEDVYPEWDGWDKFLRCKICKQCGDREPIRDRLCEMCGNKG